MSTALNTVASHFPVMSVFPRSRLFPSLLSAFVYTMLISPVAPICIMNRSVWYENRDCLGVALCSRGTRTALC